MKGIAIVAGTKENIIEDIHNLCRQRVDNAETVFAAGKDIKAIVTEQASSLFIRDNLVLAIIDPEPDLAARLKGQIDLLAERVFVLVYVTGDPAGVHSVLGGELIAPEKEREKRMEVTVRAFLRRYEKKMTHEAFRLLSARIRDEAAIETELLKLVNFVGERKDIKSKDVLTLVAETHEETLFTLFDALARMDKQEVLSVFENLLLNGFNILAIHSYLVKQVRLLLQGDDLGATLQDNTEFQAFAKVFSRWKEGLDLKPGDKKQYLAYQKPYYAFKLSKTSRKLGRHVLVSMLGMLALFDFEVKRGTKFDRIRLECGLLEA